MRPLCRLGDKNVVGEVVLGSAKTVFANFRPVALLGDFVTPHPKGARHAVSKIITASPTVFCEGRPVVRVGSISTCLHKMVTGSLNIFVI
jgi:uncharacterized Zn-binding protein involved in type VI secretion